MNSTDSATAFLQSRRSCPPRILTAPGPDRPTLEALLQTAARCPDHGKLEPWRFVVLGAETRARLADAARAHATARGLDDVAIAKAVSQFDSPTLVAVIASPKPSEKIPELEQTLSAGAVCLGLVNAALASGWGASWLSGWLAHDRDFAAPAFGLEEPEWVAGLIHIGTATTTPPERPRPDMAQITDWRP